MSEIGFLPGQPRSTNTFNSNNSNNYNNFNVNSSHPLIQSSQEYMYYKKFVSIHSEDRDIIRYPNSAEF